MGSTFVASGEEGSWNLGHRVMAKIPLSRRGGLSKWRRGPIVSAAGSPMQVIETDFTLGAPSCASLSGAICTLTSDAFLRTHLNPF